MKGVPRGEVQKGRGSKKERGQKRAVQKRDGGSKVWKRGQKRKGGWCFLGFFLGCVCGDGGGVGWVFLSPSFEERVLSFFKGVCFLVQVEWCL